MLALKLLRRISVWARQNNIVKSLILTFRDKGAENKWSHSLTAQVAVVVDDSAFTHEDDWIREIGEHYASIHDQFEILGSEVPSRIVIFKNGTKIQFLFMNYNVAFRLFSSLLPRHFVSQCELLVVKDAVIFEPHSMLMSSKFANSLSLN
jgi:hypothetical protein